MIRKKLKPALAHTWIFQMANAGYTAREDYDIDFSTLHGLYKEDIENDLKFIEVKKKCLEE